MIKATMFDWDGVIVDSAKAQYEWFEYCCKQFNKDYPFENIDDMKRNLKEPFYETFKEFGFDWDDKRDEIIEMFHEYMNNRDIPLKKGIRKQIKRLRENDVKLGIVSSNREEVIGKKLREKGIKECFDSIITHRQSDKYLKPDPRMLEVCIERLESNNSHSAYLGDQPTDIIAANELGVKSIGVTWGFSNREELEKEDPDYILDEPKQISEVVLSIK